MDNIKNDNYYVNQIIADIEKILLYAKDVGYDELCFFFLYYDI